MHESWHESAAIRITFPHTSLFAFSRGSQETTRLRRISDWFFSHSEHWTRLEVNPSSNNALIFPMLMTVRSLDDREMAIEARGGERRGLNKPRSCP